LQRDPDLGYQYTLALCAAIEDATRTIQRRRADAFDYRGRTLRYALERLLYVELVNDQGLYGLFGESRLDRPRTRVELSSRIERQVARLACGERAARAVTSSGPGTASRVVGRLRAGVAGPAPPERAAAAAPPAPPARERPICFLLHQPKFLRFVRPVLALLPPDAVAVLSNEPDLRGPSEELGVAFVGMDDAPGSDLLGTPGPGLAEHGYLPWQLDRIAAELGRLRARCVVVVEGNHPLDELANQACALIGIPCLCFQHGWSPIVHTGFRNLSFSAMLVWGEGFAELLAPASPGQRFVVTGSPMLDASDARPGRLAGVVGGRRAVTFFLQNESRLISRRHLDELGALIRDAGRRFPGAAVLVRDHPGIGTPLDGLDDAGIVPAPPAEYGLAEVLSVSAAAVSIYSTTLLEAAALLVPPLAYNMTSLPRYLPDVELAGAGLEVRARGAAVDAIGRLLADEAERGRLLPGMEAMRERYFAGADGRAAERIAAEISTRAHLDGAVRVASL
jgi:hypothetical protein